jgi:Family of unknown function (DUF5681)
VIDRPTSSKGEDDRIGYRRPPKHTRFKKGNRANPLGRGASKRGDFDETVCATLGSKVEIGEGGRKRKVTRREANIVALVERAKRGDVSAADRLLDLHAMSAKGGGGRTTVIEVYNVLPDEDFERRPHKIFNGDEAPRPDPGAQSLRRSRS